MLEAAPAGPDADRPRRAAGTEVTELAGGLIIRPARSVAAHRLNNTASVIVDLCDGTRTATQIAAALAEAFGLDTLPQAEVTACLAGLRHAGILAERPRPAAENSRLKNPFGFFDAIFCLNLDGQPDRWATTSSTTTPAPT